MAVTTEISLTSDPMGNEYCINGYFREGFIFAIFVSEYNKFVKIKTHGNTLIWNVDFFLCEHNCKIKN